MTTITINSKTRLQIRIQYEQNVSENQDKAVSMTIKQFARQYREYRATGGTATSVFVAVWKNQKRVLVTANDLLFAADYGIPLEASLQ